MTLSDAITAWLDERQEGLAWRRWEVVGTPVDPPCVMAYGNCAVFFISETVVRALVWDLGWGDGRTMHAEDPLFFTRLAKAMRYFEDAYVFYE